MLLRLDGRCSIDADSDEDEEDCNSSGGKSSTVIFFFVLIFSHNSLLYVREFFLRFNEDFPLCLYALPRRGSISTKYTTVV